MTKNKTRAALVSSVISLLLCFSMLLGTTFAWFTDEATTGVNMIQAGTLDIALVDEAGNSLEGQSLSFIDANGGTDILWEPGATFKTGNFKIVNQGNLHLKYKVVVNGINDGSNAKLLEAIEFTLGDTFAMEGTLAPGASTDAICLKGHMKEEAGNEYQGLSLIGLGITVYATQLEAEYDSFDNKYDADATNPVLPAGATLTLLTGDELKINGTPIDIGNQVLGTTGDFTLAYGVKYEASEDYVESQPYSKWFADFVVTSSTDLDADDYMLAGNYGDYGWILPHNFAVTANTPMRLIQPVIGAISYEQVIKEVTPFTCGIVNKGMPDGTVITIDLRAYETKAVDNGNGTISYEETGKSYSLGQVRYEVSAPEDLPQAEVTTLTDEITFKDFYTDEAYTLGAAYRFTATESAEDAQNSPYANWIADFVITVDKDIPANSVGLAGQYDAMGSSWYGMVIDSAVAANDPVRLLKLMGWPRTYYDLCNEVKQFQCGVVGVGDGADGATLTVELRLYEVDANGDETGVSYLVCEETHTFG